MNKIYYLSTCDTCKRLMKEWQLDDTIEKIDLKRHPLNESELESLYQQSGSYELLFNKRARLLREKGLKSKDLKEDDFKALLLEHYSYLARPVVLLDQHIFSGNSKANSEALMSFLSERSSQS